LTLASLKSGTWIPASPVLLRLQFYTGFEKAFASKSEVEKEIGSHVHIVKKKFFALYQDYLREGKRTKIK